MENLQEITETLSQTNPHNTVLTKALRKVVRGYALEMLKEINIGIDVYHELLSTNTGGIIEEVKLKDYTINLTTNSLILLDFTAIGHYDSQQEIAGTEIKIQSASLFLWDSSIFDVIGDVELINYLEKTINL